jgi:transcriptional regulator with XRE-family HTH domain
MSRRVPRDTTPVCEVCGWFGKTTTANLAEHALRIHSCDKQRRRDASRARHELRMSQIDRTPKPCLHKQARHEHGTNAAYVLDKCRCLPCSRARVAVDRQRTRLKAYGRYDRYVDADPARQHIRGLMGQGMGLKRIVKVSDLSQGMLWKLLYGKRVPGRKRRQPSKRILATTEARVLAVHLDLADGAMIDGTCTARRIQALVAAGWSMSKIAARLGINRANFTPLAHGRRKVTAGTARAVWALYRELVDVAPPEGNQRDRIAASRARNYARHAGWEPVLRIGGRAFLGAPLDQPDSDAKPGTAA